MSHRPQIRPFDLHVVTPERVAPERVAPERETKKCETKTSIFLSAIFLSFLSAFFVLASEASAHPFHAALAEVELNRETNAFEVALRIDAVDLEQALRTETKKPVDLDKTDESTPLIKRYVANQFRVRPTGGKWQAQKWIGWELEGRNAWLYFEIPVSRDATKLDVQFTVLLNQVPRQVNMLALTIEGKRHSVMFHGDKSRQAILLFEKPSPPSVSIREVDTK